MGTCNNPQVSCDTCFEVLIGDCLDDIDLSLGLTPSTTFFFRLIDKFGIEYDFSQTTDVSGDFTIDRSLFLDNLINQYAGDFELQVFSDSGRTLRVSIVNNFTAYQCVLLTQELSGENLIDSPGAYKNALSTLFNGTNNHVKIDGLQSDLVGTTQGAWTFRIKLTSLVPTSVTPIAIGGTTTSSILGFLFTPFIGSVRIINIVNGVTKWELSSQTGLLTTNWAHVGITHGGVTPKLYFQGIPTTQNLAAVTDLTAWVAAGDGVFDNATIGASRFLNIIGSFFPGNIDEVRAWNVFKTDAQMLADHNRGVSIEPDPVGLVSSYKMGDGDTFPTIKDHKGNNIGTMVNMAANDFVADVSS